MSGRTEAGVRPNRSTPEHIFNVLIEKHVDHHQDLYHNFIDFKKAFDRVWYKGLWQVMRRYNIDEGLVTLLESLCGPSTSAVLHEEKRVFVGDSIVRKTDRVLNKGDDVVVCLPGAKIEAITERVKNIVGSGKGGSVLVHVGTNNVEREGTTAIVRKYRQLVRTLKQTRVEQVILSGILPVMGRRGHKYRNCRGMAINMLVHKLCREEEVGFVDLWGSFVGRADMYMKDGLHLSGKGAAVFADKLSAAVDSDLGTMTNIFGSKHSLN